MICSQVSEPEVEIIGGQLGAGYGASISPSIHASKNKTKIIKKNWKWLIGELLEWLF